MNFYVNRLVTLTYKLRLLSVAIYVTSIGVLIATERVAQAELVLRSIDVTLNALNLETYDLDVDSNGSTDFTFSASYVPDPMLPVGFDVVNFPFASNNGVVIDRFTGDGFPSASLLSLGDLVTDAQLYSLASFDQGNLFFAVGVDPPTGNFSNRSGYVGLKFDRPGGISYGFAELAVNDINAAVNPLGLTIRSVGYNSTLGAPVQISSVPEPSTLTLFVVSSMVSVCFRRNRKLCLRK